MPPPSLSPAPEPPKRAPMDLAAIRRQIHDNMAKWDWPSLPSTPTMMTAMSLRQLDPHLPPPTPSSTPLNEPPNREPYDITAPTSQIRHQQETLDQIFLSVPLMMLPPTTSQSADDHPNLPPVPLATLTLSTKTLSRIGKFLNKISTHNLTLWMPAALYQRHTLNGPTGHSLLPDNHPANGTGTPLFPATILYHTTIQKYTDNPHPATYATRFFNPAFDIHLMRNRQHCYQYSTRRPWATPVQALAQNKRPP